MVSRLGGRVKHILLGRTLTGGDTVELQFSGGWVVGRYEWSTDPAEPPYFHYSIELEADGEVAPGRFPIPEGALLRWPVG
jgi:hypothetical protein